MADISTVLIPQDPYFVPSDAAIEMVKLIFECFHAGAEVSYRTSEKPKFTDAGSGFEKLTCPACGEIIERFELPEEYDEWWDDFMEGLYANDSDDLTQIKTQMPCCHKEVMATSIDFKNEAGFCKFMLELKEWDWDEMPGKELLLFERILGCKLTQIMFVDD